MKLFKAIRELIFGKLIRMDSWMRYKLQTDSEFANALYWQIKKTHTESYKSKLGYCAKDVILNMPDTMCQPQKVFLYEDTSIFGNGKFIISEKGEEGKFIMKKHSSAAEGLTVITGSHGRAIGKWFNDVVANRALDVDKDVVVEEDVWLGANVTLLSGVTVGRGATVGAGAVVRSNVPPYSIVAGNPAKVVGFSFKPEEIIEHEKALYPEEERMPLAKLEKNYKRYFVDRLVDIQKFTRL